LKDEGLITHTKEKGRIIHLSCVVQRKSTEEFIKLFSAFFHYVARLIFLCKPARPDIPTAFVL